MIKRKRLSDVEVESRLARLNLKIKTKYSSLSKEIEVFCLCGNSFKILPLNAFDRKYPVSCGCGLGEENKPTRYQGYKEISMSFWTAAQRSAKRRNIKFDIQIEDAWDLFIKQNRKCALSGIEIGFARNFTEARNNQTASIDRIDPEKGYVANNIQWVHKKINIMKWTHKNEDFIEICHKISQYNKIKE